MRIKRKLSLLAMSVFGTLAVASCGAKNSTIESSTNSESSSKEEQLQIVRLGDKMSEDQVVSQIKREYLLKNGGYSDEDEVSVILKLKSPSLVEHYLEETKYSSVSEFAASKKGAKIIDSLSSEQNEIIAKLKGRNLIREVTHSYTTVLNGISVTCTYGDFKNLTDVTGITASLLCEEYARVQSTDASTISNAVEVYSTGIFDSSSVDFNGEGTAVAVLDSGFDCSHSVFQNQPTKTVVNEETIASVLTETNAYNTTEGLQVSDLFYSKKIPFTYDYADKDTDVFPYDSDHGTHVAGIIGGDDDTITGVATHTQLVCMKVFPDIETSGAEQSDIVAALEDAVLLGVDAINLSLGQSCGFSRESDEKGINEIYDRINEAGISLCTAAGNDYSSAYGGDAGNSNKVTNPDSGVIGSPGSYAASLTVASVSGVKSKYVIGNGEQTFFFNESNNVNGKSNDFYKELGLADGETRTVEYVTVPGVGLKVNYSSINVKGKVALVKRGDNTFEEKAANAKAAGAIAIIVYNNVEGEILMSMGKTDHIPCVSISKEDGLVLASKKSGTLTFNNSQEAGPFMSDFSSLGPVGDLTIKPEITAHGGTIYSSVPGGGYDEMSGTSMATPNMCGIVVLIRQYLKEKYPSYTAKEISDLANQLFMSTASIVKNKEGNPYSPRKQGAGLASLKNAVTTNAYITVDGSDRTKLELGDDKARTGKYTMNFNVENFGSEAISYDLDVLAMTESVSTSDSDYVAEKTHMIDGTAKYYVNGSLVTTGSITVSAGSKIKVSVEYEISAAARSYIEASFSYGMYVEGFITLTANGEEVDLSIPFLAFYGDWTEAPMLDKTFYEVESEAHNAAIDDDKKIKADYYATTPYGSIYSSYIVPLGAYLYTVDKTQYDEIAATVDKIALSDSYGAIDGIGSVYVGLLRNAKTLTFEITDKLTGEVIYTKVIDNARKAHNNGGSAIPNIDFKKILSSELGLVNNRQYTLSMVAALDYEDGGLETNQRNTFEFDFYMDNQAPVVKNAQFETVYDKSLKKNRYYVTLTIYDNHYAMSVCPVIFTSSSTYSTLSENAIPVYSEKNSDSTVRIEITDYLDLIKNDSIIPNAICFTVDDYALNSDIYAITLPGTRGDFGFTSDGSVDGKEQTVVSAYVGEVVDLTSYLYSKDASIEQGRDYLKYLSWESSNANVAVVENGQVVGKKKGRATITVHENLYSPNKSATIVVNVQERDEDEAKGTVVADSYLEELEYSYFETLYAHSVAGQTSKIGETGDKVYTNVNSGVTFYPGEKIQLHYNVTPWYVEGKYTYTFTSSNPSVASVDENGIVMGLKEGSTYIILSASGSNIKARIRVTILSEFVIESRTLVAYKGLGGDVVIPDDEGITTIGAYAFCLYTTNKDVAVDDNNYDANKEPQTNTTITSVVIPDGVEDINKYAFYNLTALTSVTLPSTVKYIRENAFMGDKKLESINLDHVLVIGTYAFNNCTSLKAAALTSAYTVGKSAFEKCSSIESLDLTALRNTGARAFAYTSSLKSVVLVAETKLSEHMFVSSGLESITLSGNRVPANCFTNCFSLASVTIENEMISIGTYAFSGCKSLTSLTIQENIKAIDAYAFNNCLALTSVTLPGGKVILGEGVFNGDEKLTTVVFSPSTQIEGLSSRCFRNTGIEEFDVSESNYYSSTNGMVMDKIGSEIILVAPKLTGSVEIPNTVSKISSGAFAATQITELTINYDIEIGSYAFSDCIMLEAVTLPSSLRKIGAYAFANTGKLKTIENLSHVEEIGAYAFKGTGLTSIIIDCLVGEYAFTESSLVSVTLYSETVLGKGAFAECSTLNTVEMSKYVDISDYAFYKDKALFNIDLSNASAIGEYAFYNCNALKNADLSSAKTIGAYAFSDCATLEAVTLKVVEELGEGAFSKYLDTNKAPAFTSITLPSTLRVIGKGAFAMSNLTEITIPSGVAEIGEYAFAQASALKKVVLPDTVLTIGAYAFAACSVLYSINLENVKEIGAYAFNSTSKLATVDLSSLEYVGEGAFVYAGLKGNIIANNLKAIDVGAFQSVGIESFVAEELESIGEGAFYLSSNLKTFLISGDLVELGTTAFTGTAIERFYYVDGSEKTTGVVNDYVQLEDGVLYTMNGSALTLAAVPAKYPNKTLTVLEGTEFVEFYAGNENAIITSIVFPGSLKSIGAYAFYGCTALKSVEFRSYNAPKLESYYNSELSLDLTDPGYSILHAHHSMFVITLYNTNFVGLVGKNEPLEMILPKNLDLVGYDALAYLGYFGSVDNATRSEYEAMSDNTITFISYAKEVMALSSVTLENEALVNTTNMYYQKLNQSIENYGYTKAEADAMIAAVKNAIATIKAIKLEQASDEIKALASEITSLNTVFSLSRMEELKDLTDRINSLSMNDLGLLDLTNYNTLMANYDAYLLAVSLEAEEATATLNSTMAIATGVASILASLSLCVFILKKNY